MEISSKNQEEISVSYFKAVVARANAVPNIHGRDEDGVDASVSKVMPVEDGKEFDSKIEFQLKSVYSKAGYGINDDGNIYYDLKVKNYNDLVRDSAIDKYLVLLILPENKEEWVTQTKDFLTIKQGMYYLSLKGKNVSTNRETVRVYIPTDNLFDSDHLIELLKKAANGDDDDVKK